SLIARNTFSEPPVAANHSWTKATFLPASSAVGRRPASGNASLDCTRLPRRRLVAPERIQGDPGRYVNPLRLSTVDCRRWRVPRTPPAVTTITNVIHPSPPHEEIGLIDEPDEPPTGPQ